MHGGDYYYSNYNNNYSREKGRNLFKEYGLCGIKNYGANCYLNSGLQIIARCDIFIEWLNKINYPKEDCPFIYLIRNVLNEILKSDNFIPKAFINDFCRKNDEFHPNTQNCSQLFIRTVLSNINDEIKNYNEKKGVIKDIVQNIDDYYPKGDENKSYSSFLMNNNVFPQSVPYSFFSGVIKIKSTGTCNNCGKVKKYSFMDFFDLHMYLDTITVRKTDFENILRENLGYPINVKSSCPKCNNKIRFEDISKIIKLPDILVFTIERYIGETNRMNIDPNEKIDIKNYIDESIDIQDTCYELFAINIRFGYSSEFGHQICQIKKGENWFTLNDDKNPNKSDIDEYSKYSYGLFYKKGYSYTKKHHICENNCYNHNYKINNNNDIFNNKINENNNKDFDDNKEITIILKLKGKEMNIKIKKDNYIGDIKAEINLLDSIWIINNNVLSNEKKFKDYDIKNGDFIYVNEDIFEESEQQKEKKKNNNIINIERNKYQQGIDKGIDHVVIFINENKESLDEEKRKKKDEEEKRQNQKNYNKYKKRNQK